MKISGITSLAAAAALAASALPAPSQAGIGFRITGGASCISYGDYNDFADEMNSEMGGVAELDNIEFIPEFGVEVYYSFIPSLDVGVGIGLLMAESDVYVAEDATTFSWEHKMKSVPLTATAYFRPPLPFVRVKPYIYAGAGYYYTDLKFDMMMTDGGDIFGGYDAKLDDWSFGFHGGGGIEFSVVPTITLDLGVRLRKADVQGFEGTATNAVDGEKESVFLRCDDDYGFGPDLMDNKPYRDEGSVDLSGYMFYAGFKLGF